MGPSNVPKDSPPLSNTVWGKRNWFYGGSLAGNSHTTKIMIQNAQ